MRFVASLDRTSSVPVVMVPLLLSVNVGLFFWLFYQSQEPNIPVNMLFRSGAMYSDAFNRGEYWRMITAGFLHANPLHILGNMLCLIIWGGPLEKRLGSLYFTVVYAAGLVGGAIASHISHGATPFLSVGASGAISALLGALLALQLIGRIRLDWSFFVVNISLNIALAIGISRIDWGAHLGGFLAGMVACACLDLLERVFARLLRCKFPEFVKMNGFVVFVIVAAYCWNNPLFPLSQQNIWVLALGAVVVCFTAVKVTDLILSIKKGLAVVVAALALANAGLVLLWSSALAQALASLCTARLKIPDAAAVAVAGTCANVDRSIMIAAAIVLLTTTLLYWRVFVRGIADVGFVGGALRAERARHPGL
ncbi:MAG TPA: rhomboid family intramembrane serine protease [Xanthobacteraceae bacterium]|nr:rhomboid family intramembrane serine protease [Xanthobacteraceae bacterium]